MKSIKDKRKIIIIIILILLSLLVIGVYYSTNKKSNKKDYLLVNIDRNNNVNNPINYEEVINDIRSEYNNDDIVGILEIENTDYIVPILQGEDNEYYLNHLPNKEENFMGSVFLDYRVNIDSSRKLLIYGHNKHIGYYQ